MPNIFLLLFILGAIWGSSFFAIKISIETLHPITVASGRLIIAAFVLYIFLRDFFIFFERFPRVLLLYFLVFLLYFCLNPRLSFRFSFFSFIDKYI